jgi:hypothetical protein
MRGCTRRKEARGAGGRGVKSGLGEKEAKETKGVG